MSKTDALKSWITAKDIQDLNPKISITEARNIIKIVQKQMIDEGAYVIKSKWLMAPAHRIREFLDLEK